MNIIVPDSSRRRFLAALAASFAVPGAFAEQLMRTPTVGEGPFYPDKLPLDTDNDLVRINDKLTPAVGEVTHLSGQVFGLNGSPIRNAVVEIWQVDGNGVYIHSGSDNGDKRDGNFQGYGRFLTDSKGRYYFRTVKPVSYPGRTPHIHVIVRKGEKRMLTTQLFIKGEKAKNDQDFLYRRVPEKSRPAVLADFMPLKDSTAGELTATWDIVIGKTPEEPRTRQG